MVLAEIEVFVSPPHAPTRRISMGDGAARPDREEGDRTVSFMAVLVGAIASRFWRRVDDEVAESIEAILDDVVAGRRLSQPRARHRLQSDRIGLKRCRHRLVGDGEAVHIEIAERPGTPTQHLLAAAYAIAAMPLASRPMLVAAFRYGATWSGPLDTGFMDRVTQRRLDVVAHGAGNVAWALAVLDLTERVRYVDGRPDLERRTIMRSFRERLLDVHPDRGADDDTAAARIADLAEARRILMAHR